MLCALWIAKVGHRYILQAWAKSGNTLLLSIWTTGSSFLALNVVRETTSWGVTERQMTIVLHFNIFFSESLHLLGNWNCTSSLCPSFTVEQIFISQRYRRLGDTWSLQSHNTFPFIIKAKPAGDVISNYENVCRTKSLISYSHAFIMKVCAMVAPQTAGDTGFGLGWTLLYVCFL